MNNHERAQRIMSCFESVANMTCRHRLSEKPKESNFCSGVFSSLPLKKTRTLPDASGKAFKSSDCSFSTVDCASRIYCKTIPKPT